MSAITRPHESRIVRAARALLLVALLLVALLGGAAAPLAAQASPRARADGWRTSRVLKWSLLATSVGFGLWAYRESNRADDAYDALRRRCEADVDRCRITAGAYADATAEALYDRSNAGDRRARTGLLAGQAFLLGSAAFFIVDLRHGGPPSNIPYDPDRPRKARLEVGVRVPLPR